MASATLQRDAAGECYAECEHIIRATVAGFIERCGGNWDDLMAEANLAFVDGYRAFNRPEFRAKRGYDEHNPTHFTLNIRRWVLAQLRDYFRTKTQHRCAHKVIVKHEEKCELFCDPKPAFNMLNFTDSLSEDARVAAQLVLDTPADLCRAAVARGGSERNLRCLIRQHLAGLGWSSKRVNEVFEEIRLALT